MKKNLIMFRSVTSVIRSRDLLKVNRISSQMIRTPAHLRGRSCGYSLLVMHNFDRAIDIITSGGIAVLGTATVDFR